MSDTGVRRGLDVAGAIKAGLIAGLVFVVVEMVLVGIMMGTPFGPPRMMAAIAMGTEVLPPPASFDFAIFAVGMIVHFALSVVLALVFAVGLALIELSRSLQLLAGLVLGLVVYAVNFYGFTAVFPWFAMARNPITISAHALFGLTLAWAYRPASATVTTE